MVKHTVKSLKNLLNQFPENTPIINEISIIWIYPDEINQEKTKYSKKEFEKLTMNNTLRIGIYEGSWENNTIADIDNTLKKTIKESQIGE